jgi:serine/threonine protein kinase/formylglycine-generating enzyme required for sulfatase activity
MYKFAVGQKCSASNSIAPNFQGDGVSTEQDQDLPAPRTEALPLQAGARVGRYLILARVGSGAMGVVYGAYDPELDRRIALKLLDGDPRGQDAAARARLLREAKAMARVEHPNVIAVHDVGVFEGRVFLAMEFLAGGTLRDWLEAERRGWREVLAAFLAAGRGLAAAHAAGLVHRDFKPENVLLDKDGRPRVVDFGLAREAARPDDGESVASYDTATLSLAAGNPLESLTRTGAVMGTPAYMAPEQFLGEPTDARTDQFSFCVALYEALYGERPFAGETVLRLLRNMTDGTLQPVREERDVPAWIRRVLARGLSAGGAARWPSMAALIAALEDDPATRHRRRLLAGVAFALVVLSVLAVSQLIRQRRLQVERQIAARLDDADRSSRVGRAQAVELRQLRRRAFAAFDLPDRVEGEALWTNALAMFPIVDAAYEHAEQAYEAALVLDPSRAAVRASLADLLYQHLLLAEEVRRRDRIQALAAALARHDEKRRRLDSPGALIVRTHPDTATITLERYERNPVTGRLVAKQAGPAPAVVGQPIALAPGSYRLSARAHGFADLAYPFEIARGERRVADLTLPPASAVPSGFVYVSAGDFWFGDADEELRTQFLDTVPIHKRTTGAYLIGRNEVTFRDWVAFLENLPPSERSRLSPDASSAATRGALRLRRDDDGWQLVFQPAFQPSVQRHFAHVGEPVVYAARKVMVRQNWLDFPVSGVSSEDANRYLAWLRTTHRVPGARLCTELEWEKAARGADDRLYPHGDQLRPDDANFDLTYGRVGPAYGPDAVGSHPASRSPFGVDDLAGNVWEIVVSSLEPDEIAVRGGAYYFGAASCRSTNREVGLSTLRDMMAGFRVCASVGAPED